MRLLLAPDSSIPIGPGASLLSELPPVKVTALALAMGLVALLLILIVGVGLAFFDLRGRREEEAERLELLIINALRRKVGDLPVVPIAYVSRSGSSPAILEITGAVPISELRNVVLDVVEAELRRLRPYYRIDDRLGVREAVLPAA